MEVADVNRLEHLKEFQDILSNYHIAPAGQRVLKDSRLTLFIGPTASGRDTLSHALLKTGEFYFIVSDTTRKPRVNNGVLEKDGVEYWFRTEDEFLQELKEGRLLEAEIIHNQHVSGISIRELEKANKAGKIGITNVELNIQTIVQAKPDTVALMVLPPSFEEWMRRLTHRGAMAAPERRRRLETAVKIFAAGLEHSYFDFVINDTLDSAMEQVYLRSVLGFKDLINQIHGRKLCEQLYIETQNYLKNFR